MSDIKTSDKKENLAIDEHYIRPKRANELMKMAQNIRRTVYIFGATGYGKTTFAADYLKRRRYEYYSMTDMALTDALLPENGEKKMDERIVVVDDLHKIYSPEEREAACGILKKLAQDRHIWLILISRCMIPAWLMPLYIEHIFVTIGEEELWFTEKEEREYLDLWGLGLRQETTEKLRKTGRGYPLFLRIAAMRLFLLKKGGRKNAESVAKEAEALNAAEIDLCDYLETHVYDQWNVELSEFLMDISIVEQFDIPTARHITKKSNAGTLLQMAKETGDFFLEHAYRDNTLFEMRLVMKISMRRRLAKRCTKEHIDGLYRRAGEKYELLGKTLEALNMYQKCGYEEGISGLLVENVRKHPGNGHFWELRRYYLTLSAETISQSPELMAGMSLLQSIILNDEESEHWYQALVAYIKTQTGSAKKAAQARLLYLDIALPQRGTGQMTEILKHAWTFITERKTILPELSLTNNQPTMMHGGKDFCEWSRRDRELAKSIGKQVELLLGKFGKGLVSLALAESFLEKGKDNYEVSALAQKGKLQAMSGGKQEQVFVAVGVLAWLSLLNNHIEDAFEALKGFRTGAATETQQLLSEIDTLKTRFLLYAGRSSEVADWMKEAPDETVEFCTLERSRYITKVRVYLATGKREKAMNLLQQLILYAEKRQRTYLYMEANILLAMTQFRMGQKNWQETMQNAITQAESYHFVRILSREGAALWELFKAGDFIWKDKNFKVQVLKECEQMAHSYPVYLSEKQEGNILLSDKALKILRLQAEGRSVEQIAEALGLSRSGVKYYNRDTYKKLGVGSKAEALIEARNRKII